MTIHFEGEIFFQGKTPKRPCSKFVISTGA
jgi:hypothetical protein